MLFEGLIIFYKVIHGYADNSYLRYTIIYKIEVPEDGKITVNMKYPFKVGVREHMEESYYEWYFFNEEMVDDLAEYRDFWRNYELGLIGQSNTFYFFSKKDGKPYCATATTRALKKGSYYAVLCCSIPTDQSMYFKAFNVSFDYTGFVDGVNIGSGAGKKGAAVIQWDKVEGADGYEIMYRNIDDENAKGKTILVKNGDTTKKIIKKLKRNTLYEIKIRSYKNVKINGKSKRFYSSEWDDIKNYYHTMNYWKIKTY